MVYIAWVLSLAIAFYLGYFSRSVKNKIEVLEEQVKMKIDRPEVEEAKSEIIDPFDPIAEAQYQQKVMMEKLNGRR